MQCSVCSEHTPDAWAPLAAYEYPENDDRPFPLNRGAEQTEELIVSLERGVDDIYRLEWMRCARTECRQITVRVRLERRMIADSGWGTGKETQWLAVPQFARARPISDLVPETMARLYREASMILDISPSASAVLSRRVLADLLKQCAECNEYGLADRIHSFREDREHPKGIRDNLHHFREAANLGAHTETDKDDQAEIIEVDREEAEWTLDILDRLFDYFIVTPARDAEMQKRIEAKGDRAGRKPIAPLDD